MNYLLKRQTAVSRRSQLVLAKSGFTLLEVSIIVAIIGILLAIALPIWATLANTWRLNAAQEQVYTTIRDAQNQAKLRQVSWQASFREANGYVQWALHPTTTLPTLANWHNLDGSLKLDDETSLFVSDGIYRVQFDEDGNVNGQLGRLTLASKMGGRTKRCVMVSTLIGAIRKGQDNITAQEGKYCY